MDLHLYALLMRHLNRFSFEGLWSKTKTYRKFDIVNTPEGTVLYISMKDQNKEPLQNKEAWRVLVSVDEANEMAGEAIEAVREIGEIVKKQGEQAELHGNEAKEVAEEVKKQLDTISETLEETKEINEEFKKNLDKAVEEVGKLEDDRIKFDEIVEKASKQSEELDRIVAEGEERLEILEATKHVGAYKHGTLYKEGNEVEYNGSTFRAMTDVKEVYPSAESEQWQLIAQRGVDGEGAVATVNNVLPDEEGNVKLDGYNNDDILMIKQLSLQDYEDGNYPKGISRFTITSQGILNGWVEYIQERVGYTEVQESNPFVLGYGLVTKPGESMRGVVELNLIKNNGDLFVYTIVGQIVHPLRMFSDMHSGSVLSVNGQTPYHLDGSISLVPVTAQNKEELEDTSKDLTSPGAVKGYVEDKLKNIEMHAHILDTNERKARDVITWYPKGFSIMYCDASDWTNLIGDVSDVIVVTYRPDSKVVRGFQHLYGTKSISSDVKDKLFVRVSDSTGSWSRLERVVTGKELDEGLKAISDDLDNHENLMGTDKVRGHVSVSDNPRAGIGGEYGVAASTKATKEIYDELYKHLPVKGDSGTAGHVKLSDEPSSILGTSLGVAVTPKGLYDVKKIAEQALQSGNNVKKHVVGSLLSADEDSPITNDSKWEEILKVLDEMLEGGNTLEVKRSIGYILLSMMGKSARGTIYEDAEISEIYEDRYDESEEFHPSLGITVLFSQLVVAEILDNIPSKEEELENRSVFKMLTDFSVLFEQYTRESRESVTELASQLTIFDDMFGKIVLDLTTEGELENLVNTYSSVKNALGDLGKVFLTYFELAGGVDYEYVGQRFSGGFERFTGSSVTRDEIKVQDLEDYDIVVAVQDGMESTSSYLNVTVYLGGKLAPFYNATIFAIRIRGSSNTGGIEGYKDGGDVRYDYLPLHSSYSGSGDSENFHVYKIKV